jgi:hypothetical protein
LAKITLADILAQFASQQGLNDRFQQIEDEFNNKVLYRDEAGAMAVDLDMNGNTILNAVFDSTEISGSAAQIVYTPGANTYLTGVELQDTSDQTDAELVIQAAADAALDSRLDALEITVPANTGRITATETVADRADALSIVNETELDTTTPLATSAIQSASSVTGTTGKAVFNQQVGTDLEFKKLKEGANMSITQVGDELVLANLGDTIGTDADNIAFDPSGLAVLTAVEVQDTLVEVDTSLASVNAELDLLIPPNRAINGDLRLWQRGTSVDIPVFSDARYYSADQIFGRIDNAGSGTPTPMVQIAGGVHTWGCKITSVIAAGHELGTPIEDGQYWAGKTITISAQVLISAGAANAKLSVQDGLLGLGSGGTQSQAITPTGALQTVEFTVTLGTHVDSKDCWLIYVEADLGIGEKIELHELQVTEGTLSPAFPYRPIGEELLLAQRYYRKSYNQADAPGTMTSLGAERYVASGTSQVQYSVSFPPMLKNPTVGRYDPSTGTAGKMDDLTGATVESVNPLNSGETGFSLDKVTNHIDTNVYEFQWTATADIMT